MKAVKIAFLGFVSLSVSTCVEPYDYIYEDSSNPEIVIDGYLSDEEGIHEIRVARVTKLADFNGVELDFVDNASVSVIDDDGNKIEFTYSDNGIYVSAPNVRAMPGKSYKVRVTLNDDRVYESLYEQLPEDQGKPIGLSYKLDSRDIIVNGTLEEEQGVTVEAEIIKEDNNRFYRWDINHYFIIEADEAPEFTLQNQRHEQDTALRFCFIKDFVTQEVYLHEDISGVASGSYQQEIEYIRISPKFEYVFVVEAKQLVMPRHAYNYWKEIKSLAQNSGGLFDSSPYSVSGNIKRVDAAADEENEQLGFFGVYNASLDRKFITQSSLGIYKEFAPCQLPIEYTTPHPCEDCRLYEFLENYENNPPSWWVY